MNECCDRHPSARAQARIILPSGGVLYCCGHCSRSLSFGDDYLIEYDMVSLSATS